MRHTKGPVALVFSRQKVKTFDPEKMGPASGLQNGAYVLSDRPHFKAIVVATGSEVGLALEVQNELDQRGIPVRVVSMPSMELFLKQNHSLQETVLPTSCKKVTSIEAGSTLGWAQVTGRDGLRFGVDDYGASAPAPKIYEKFGLSAKPIAQKISAWI